MPREARYSAVLRAVADELLASGGAPSEVRADVAMAMSEAFGNAVRHAVGCAEVEVRIDVADGTCAIDVSDSGPGFVAPVSGRGRAEAPATAESGRGLHIIEALVDTVEVSCAADGTHVALTRRWDVDPASQAS